MNYRCFVILPYHTEYEIIWDAIVKSTIATAAGKHIEFVRADRESLAVMPESNVQRHISLCDFAIADISNMNPNVLYEVGFASALEKPVILLADRATNLPVNLKNRLYIRYDHAELETLALELPNFIQAALDSSKINRARDTFVATGYYTTPSSDLRILIGKARSVIDIMAIGLSQFNANFIQEVIGATKRSESLKVRILALDPDSIIVNERARQLGHQVSQYRMNLHNEINSALAFLSKHDTDRFSIKLFNDLPYFSFYRVDDTIFLGLLTGIVSSRGGVVFKVGSTSPGIDNILRTFESAWVNSTHNLSLPNQ